MVALGALEALGWPESEKTVSGHGKATRMCRTRSRRSIRLHPSQNGGCADFIEDSEVRISRCLDSFAKTQIMVQYGRSSRSF